MKRLLVRCKDRSQSL